MILLSHRSPHPQDFLDVLEKRKETYERITGAVQAMIRNSDPTTAASLQKQLDEVKEVWEQVSTKAEEEGHKLDDALKNAEELEKQLTDMESWLTQVHDQIVSLDHVSSILDVLEKQRNEHKVRRKGQAMFSSLSLKCSYTTISTSSFLGFLLKLKTKDLFIHQFVLTGLTVPGLYLNRNSKTTSTLTANHSNS